MRIRSLRNYIKMLTSEHLRVYGRVCIRDIENICGFYIDINLFQDVCKQLKLSSTSS